MRAAPRTPPTAPPTAAVLRRSEAQEALEESEEMVGVEVNGAPVDTAVPTTMVGSLDEDGVEAATAVGDEVVEIPAVDVWNLNAPMDDVVILGDVALAQQLVLSLASRQQ